MPKNLGINIEDYENGHRIRLDEAGNKIKIVYSEAIEEAALMASSVTFNVDKPFKFSDYPKIKENAQKLLKATRVKIVNIIDETTDQEWLQAHLKNDKIIDYVFKDTKVTKEQISRFYDRNVKAYDTFKARKINGLGLSDKVWKLTEQFEQELEMSLDIGLLEGKPASRLATQTKKFLNEPERLFRRVRDERGVLQLSKNAKAYNPGQGVYRSSFKNAFRLTRTEGNIAYRTADFERWSKTDFVTGYRIKLSAQHPKYGFVEICERLVGIYPKTFKFTGWHPQCLCIAIPVLADADEFVEYTSAIIRGEDVSNWQFKNRTTTLPNGFVDWAQENQQRIADGKGTPYFVRDNLKKENIFLSALTFQ